MEKFLRELKSIVEAYEISKQWMYEELISEEDYINNIGKYLDLQPEEIIDELIETIKNK